MMQNFKSGDIVRYKIGHSLAAKHNGHDYWATYSISHYVGKTNLVVLSPGDRSTEDVRLELVKAAPAVDGNKRIMPKGAVTEVNLNTGDYVIMLYEDGKYKPSENPKVLKSERQALHVAKSMSKQHGGTFVAFKAIADATMPQIEPTVRKFA